MIADTVLTTILLAAHVASTPNPIKRPQEITIDNILELAPAMPEQVKTIIENFFNQHPKLLPLLSGSAYYEQLPKTDHAPFSMNFNKPSSKDKKFFSTMKKASSDVEAKILKRKYKALYNNLVINVDGRWLIKTSSLFNRRANIYHEMGLKHSSSKLPKTELEKFITTKGGRTFQTISRMIYWLRARQAQELLHLDRIYLPQKYFMHIPGRPTIIDDTNYVVVAEKIAGARPILETNLLDDREIVAQLTHVIINASLFDIHGDNVLAKNGQACLIDFEQPNSCKPSEFGRKNSTQRGISGLRALINSYAEKTNQDLTSLHTLVTEIVNSYTR